MWQESMLRTANWNLHVWGIGILMHSLGLPLFTWSTSYARFLLSPLSARFGPYLYQMSPKIYLREKKMSLKLFWYFLYFLINAPATYPKCPFMRTFVPTNKIPGETLYLIKEYDFTTHILSKNKNFRYMYYISPHTVNVCINISNSQVIVFLAACVLYM